MAVLAIYLLVLLAPLHQAAGLQRDLNDLGYVSLDTASICAALAQDENGQSAAKCAVAGIGKNEIAAVEPVLISLDAARAVASVSYHNDDNLLSAIPDHRPGRARAPPVSV